MPTPTVVTLTPELIQYRDQFRSLDSTDEANHHQIGTLYNQLSDQKVAEAAGFKRPADFVKQELVGVVSFSSVWRFARVARRYSQADAAKYGISKLDLLRQYQETIQDLAAPDAATIKLPSGDKPFASTTVKELNAALHGQAPAAGGLPEAEQAKVAQVQQALDKALGAHLARVGGRLTAGKLHLQLDVPAELLDDAAVVLVDFAF